MMMLLCGCSGGYKLDPSKHTSILVYPSIDIRTEKNLDLERYDKIRCYLKNRVWPAEHILLTKYYYNPVHLSDPSRVAITYDNLKNPNPEHLKSLGSHGTRYILSIVIKKFHSEFNVINFIKVDLEGYLIDTKTGEIIWYNEAMNNSETGGLLDPLLHWYDCGGPPMNAMNRTMEDLLENLPILKPEQQLD